MGKLNVRNGTPVGNEHLCKNCDWGLFMTGYRESDVLVFCTNARPNFRVPFVVHECSEYQDKTQPDWEQMEKLAIQIEPMRLSKKTRGFHATETLRPEEPDYEPAFEGEDEEVEKVDAVAHVVLTP